VRNCKINSVAGDDQLSMGRLKFKIYYTPGHSFDSICIGLGKNLFTGDTLFVGRTGRTISATSDVGALYLSVYEKLLVLPGSTKIYPGHDYGLKPTITIDENIKISPLLRAKNKSDFINRMNQYEASR
jgi:glyoxylase-like metal-dependent hydrolase (beta-lactamase superfamily II)